MDDMPSDTIDTPEIPETPELIEIPPVSDGIYGPEIPEVPEVTDIPDDSPTPDSDDLSFHTQPGGYEALPNLESEPIIAPHIPEIPYGGGNPERGG